ncbi:hypothetical protein F8S13_19360 [Chloroflexia bacterium SDU3-3]|nr:hypothetical protein F8S13_19360 [Chloroflexia bacterium SDU3-3]
MTTVLSFYGILGVICDIESKNQNAHQYLNGEDRSCCNMIPSPLKEYIVCIEPYRQNILDICNHCLGDIIQNRIDGSEVSNTGRSSFPDTTLIASCLSDDLETAIYRIANELNACWAIIRRETNAFRDSSIDHLSPTAQEIFLGTPVLAEPQGLEQVDVLIRGLLIAKLRERDAA